MDIDSIVDAYTRELKDQYRLFASKTRDLISSVLDVKKLTPHSITFREKNPDKLREKINREAKNYDDPLSQVTDLAGVRIITYFPRDVDDILPLIEKEFEVDRENSVDKRKAADPSSFAYASVHLVVSLRPDRLALPEYALFKDMKCEVQVRTILQHAWAEIEHDVVYKSTEDIPFELRRRFASLAGLLEIADREFEGLREDEVNVRKAIAKHVSKQDLDIAVNLDSLRSYLAKYHGEKEPEPRRLRLLLQLIRFHTLDTLSTLDSALSGDALAKADDSLRDPVAEECPREHAKHCLLRYFVALGRRFDMPDAMIAESAECPALGRPMNVSRVARRRSTRPSHIRSRMNPQQGTGGDK